MGLHTALSLVIPNKVYFSLLPLREELKIALLWDEDCLTARKSNLRTSKASWSPASMTVTGDPPKQNCAAEAAGHCHCSKWLPTGDTRRSQWQPGWWEPKMKQGEWEMNENQGKGTAGKELLIYLCARKSETILHCCSVLKYILS